MQNKKYNLSERTSNIGKEIILFCKTLKQDTISRPLISQIVRSSTSVGANYREAQARAPKGTLLISFLFAEKRYKRHSIGWKC